MFVGRRARVLSRTVKTAASVGAGMLTGLGWLALEVKYLDRARSFYET